MKEGNIFIRLKNGLSVSDSAFDRMYSKRIQVASEFYFTPVEVAIQASLFLSEHLNPHILDIGSGAGKFCLIGAAVSQGHYTGVEHDSTLHVSALKLAKKLTAKNVTFIHSNISSILFKDYTAFFLFNPFLELLQQANAGNDDRALLKAKYKYYTQFVFEQLRDMPAGTRLATYFAHPGTVPPNYDLHSTSFEDKLKCWIKGGL